MVRRTGCRRPVHRAGRAPGCAGAGSAAIGCVPWLNSEAVIDRLDQFKSLCVVIDKGAVSRDAVSRLIGSDDDGFPRGFPNSAISALAGLVPANTASSKL